MNSIERDFQEIIAVLDAHPHLSLAQLETLGRSEDDAQAMRGFILQTAWWRRAGDDARAWSALEEAVRRFPAFLPPPLFTLRADLLALAQDWRRLARDYFDYGCRALDLGHTELGLEALSAALMHDARDTMEIQLHPDEIRNATGRYEHVAQGLARPMRGSSPKEKIRIGMVVPNLADEGMAYSTRVLFFTRFLDRARFDLRVYSTENPCQRLHQLPSFISSAPTPARAPRSLAELEAWGVPVFIAPRDRPILETAGIVAQRIAEDAVDVLILQAGPAMPLDWLAVRLAPAPAKLHIHIGVPAYQHGMDITLFDNEANMNREAATWPEYAGERLLMRRGTDIEALDAVQPASRETHGLPADAVLIGTLSHHLDGRMGNDCLEVLSDTLARFPKAWYVGIGSDSVSERILSPFKNRGVAGRTRFLPKQRQPAASLKMLDIYANEFPAGGSQAVVEAMACGLPVAAMRCGNTHTESVGADIVGRPLAIEIYSPPAYAARLAEWIENPASRKAAGEALRLKAEREFSIRDYVRKVCELGAQIAARKAVCVES